MAGEAFVSLATNDDYAMGALALGRSLRDANTSKTLVLLVSNGVSSHVRDLLRLQWDELVNIEELNSGDWEHLQLLNRPELGVTFTKLHAWRLVRFQKCVFLDADTLVLCNVDELFEREEFSAAPDIGWPDCFNSGVFVYKPSLETFANLYQLAQTEGSFDGGDQGLLNIYWSDWATKDIKYHLPFVYNVTPNMYYQYAPAYKRFGKNAKIIHFIGPLKPWHHTYLPESDAVIPIPHSAYQHSPEHLLCWWHAYQATQPQPQYPTSSVTGGDPMDAPAGGEGHKDHTHNSSPVLTPAPTWQQQRDQWQGQHDQQHGQHDQQHGQHDQQHGQHGGSPFPRHHSVPSARPSHTHRSTLPVPGGYHLRPSSRARSPAPRRSPTPPAHTTRSSVPRVSSDGARPTSPEQRSGSREPSTGYRREAWQRGEVDYLGEDKYDDFIGPLLVPPPPNRRMAWQQGDIDYMGVDSYDVLIEQLLSDTLNLYLPDDEDENYVDEEYFDQ